MIYLILLFLAYGIEPAVWLLVLTRVFEKKNDVTNSQLLMSWIGSYLIICLKQVVALLNVAPSVEIILFVLLILYYIWQYNMIFIVKQYKLLTYVGTMYIIALLSECIATALAVIIGWKVQELSQFGVKGVVATYISKLFLVLICKFLYGLNGRRIINILISTPKIILILLTAIASEIPTIIVYNNMRIVDYKQWVLLSCVVGQIFFFFMIGYFVLYIERHERIEREYNERMKQAYVKIKAYEEANEREIRKYKHDLKKHIIILDELYKEKKYNDAENYLVAIRTEMQATEKFFSLRNKIVEALLNQKRKEILEREIKFVPQIGIDDFIMDDIDICSVLSNLIDNAIEATYMVIPKEREIELSIMGKGSGYLIEVCNTYLKEPTFIRGEFITNKEVKGNHGIGIKIVRRTVKKYGGKSRFEYSNSKFIARIYIPGRQEE